VERSLEFEIKRQEKLYRTNTPPATDETRGFNDARGETELQRGKESAKDYRYFPEPDLPALDLVEIREKITLPELPAARRERLVTEYQISGADARILVEEPKAADYFESVISELRAWLEAQPESEGSREEIWEENRARLSRLTLGWLVSKLWGMMAERHITMKNLKIDPENFAEFITLIHTAKINSSAAQIILSDMLDLGKDPSQIMEDRSLGQINDTDTIAPIVERLIRENPKLAEDYRAGRTQLIKVFLGLLMKATEGRADPRVAEELLKLHLDH
jgi:aspartyl-tRNA(Asn)/glutamyl-tRNA(Gln) amidotransferase subunit B